ncbi:MAG: universal stress protein [Bacteroidota bacterium]
MKNILVPTDFSDYAVNALNFAIEISRINQTKVYVIHVLEYPVGGTVDPVGMFVPTPSDKGFVQLLSKNADLKMEEFCKDVKEECEAAVQIGNPYPTIIETIEEKNIDLVIMGTKGASGLKEVFIGSNAERVVRFAKCPVITTNSPVNFRNIKSIAFAIDINNTPDRVFVKLKELQTLFDAKLHLVHINTPNDFERDQLSLRYLRSIVKDQQMTNIEIHVFNDYYTEDGIFSFAEHYGTDLIAMTTHGRRGLSHLVSGSLAEDVVNHAKRPVWTCRVG